MAVLYQPTEFEKACLTAFESVCDESDSKGIQLFLQYVEDKYELIFGYDIIMSVGPDENRKKIASINSMVTDSEIEEIVKKEGELSEQLKTKIFSDSERISYLNLDFPEEEILDPVTLWYHPKDKKFDIEEYFSKEEGVCKKFSQYREWVEKATQLKVFDSKEIAYIAKKALEVVIDAHCK